MTHDDSWSADDSVDELLRAIANHERRALMSHRHAEPTETLPLDSLVNQRTVATTTCELDLRIRLHHVHLPELDDAGIIDSDPATQTITYHGRPILEVLFDIIERY